MKLRASTPAAASSTSDTATCMITSVVEPRLLEPVSRPPGLMSGATSPRAAVQLGATPKRIVVSSVTTSVKMMTRASVSKTSDDRNPGGGTRTAGISLIIHIAIVEAGYRAESAEERTFRHQLAEEPHPCGADGDAHGKLAAARDAPCQQQIRDVDARNHDDEQDQAEECDRVDAADLEFPRQFGDDARAAPLGRVTGVTRHGGDERCDLGVRGIDRRPGLAPCDDVEPARLPLIELFATVQHHPRGRGNPDVAIGGGLEVTKVPRKYAEDRHRDRCATAKIDRAPNERGVRAEALRPECVAQDHARVCREGGLVSRCEEPPVRRPNSEHR